MTDAEELRSTVLQLLDILEGLQSGTLQASQDVAKRVRALRDRYQGRKAVDQVHDTVQKSMTVQQNDQIARLESASREFMDAAARSPSRFSHFWARSQDAARAAERLRRERDAHDPIYQREVEAYVEAALRRRHEVRK